LASASLSPEAKDRDDAKAAR